MALVTCVHTLVDLLDGFGSDQCSLSTTPFVPDGARPNAGTGFFFCLLIAVSPSLHNKY